MRFSDIINESARQTYRVFHGSPYPNIGQFRTDNLRNRTGTPSTLSFTTSIETAKIYGETIYEAEVSGVFGDYLNPDDCQKNFDFRWPAEEKWHTSRYNKAPQDYRGVTLEDMLGNVRTWMMREITEGYYAQWENPAVWRACGWDGAWCHESGSRNLIVGKSAQIKMIGKI